MDSEELYAQNAGNWNWESRWDFTWSAHELVLAQVGGDACIPARYALQLLVDLIGEDGLPAAIAAIGDPSWGAL